MNPTISLIPQPSEMIKGEGAVVIDEENPIVYNNTKIATLAHDLAEHIRAHCGFKPKVIMLNEKPTGSYGILLMLNEKDNTHGPEGYELTINKENTSISANDPAGVFYGIQTIRQLLFESRKKTRHMQSKCSLPIVFIKDKPRFSWRGLMLDVSRHFMTKDFIMRYIDLIAYHKMNVLHLHLSDDQAWRIEIKKYPRLTEVGSTRIEKDGSIHKGYYSRNDMREIIAYAQKRFITIVPEIDFPCHAIAALAAYPDLSCTGGPFTIKAEWGIFAEALCIGNIKTFEFMRDVLDEVIDLFPSRYIHIGGDECRTTRWEKCPKCQLLVKNANLGSVHNLEKYFIKKVEKYLSSKNKRMIGWDEIIESKPGKSSIVQIWRDHKRAMLAAQNGNQVIISPFKYLYLDYPLSVIDLKRIYLFEPIPQDSVTVPALAAMILGGETTMWTEYAPQDTIDGKVFPRLLAVCEILWTSAYQKNYPDFYSRVQFHYNRLKALGVAYGSETEPWIYNIKHYFSRKWD